MKQQRWYEQGELPDTDWERFALLYVERLIKAEWDAAEAMTSSIFQTELAKIEAPPDFARRFTEKVIMSEEGPTGPYWLMSSLSAWPDKEHEVLGLAMIIVEKGRYENSERFDVTVMRENGELRIKTPW